MTVVVFSVNREHVGTSQDFRKITWHVGVEQGRIWSSVVPFSTAYTWMILLKRRARERGHYRGFACGYPWRDKPKDGKRGDLLERGEFYAGWSWPTLKHSCVLVRGAAAVAVAVAVAAET
ncbi:hypothetical protein V1478_009805 [Vespula squamosa]|uniref:Uncharacterized protein n=1 Tax=Vespula squamosa TaxID=30214 RepID=A0ABD2AJG7_VESSQ